MLSRLSRRYLPALCGLRMSTNITTSSYSAAASSSSRNVEAEAANTVKARCIRLEGGEHEFDKLIDSIDPNVQVVLIGEASHGTHDFYRERAYITRRLISERGFNVVALESDLP